VDIVGVVKKFLKKNIIKEIKMIKTQRKSDHGYYGTTGKYENPNLPINNCKCGKKGVLTSNYDDTVGFKETVYQLECVKCDIKTVYTCILENVINEWNEATKSS
jgi:hypothetical protein